MSQRRHHSKIQSLYGCIKASTIQYWIDKGIDIAGQNIIL